MTLMPEHFLENNIYSQTTKVPHQKLWEKLLPSRSFFPSSDGVDISVTFSFNDIDTGVRKLMNKCKLFEKEEKISKEYYDTFKYLRECLQEFTNLLPNKSYKVKIESSKGNKGQKCPKWHTDYVPIRLILALHEPGVNYALFPETQYKNYVNACNEIDVHFANEIMDKEFGECIKRFDAGDYVVLRGKKWKSCDSGAIHRSPNMNPFQGRVVMTVDVVED